MDPRLERSLSARSQADSVCQVDGVHEQQEKEIARKHR
jgi:hypothetical protein